MGIYAMVVELVWSRGAQQTKIEILVQKLQMIRKIQLLKLILIAKVPSVFQIFHFSGPNSDNYPSIILKIVGLLLENHISG